MKTRNLAIVAVAAVAVVAVIAGVYWYSLPHYPWLFRGAYANYTGNITVLFVPIQLQVRLEVMDYNATHARVFTLTRINALGTTTENSTITWVAIKEGNFAWPGMTFNRTYEGDYYIEGYGVRHCYVAENVGGGGKGLVYVDSQTLWPLMFELEAPGFSLKLNLVDTNIQGLK